MRIVLDTNVVFSALLNTNGKLSRIILQPKSGLNFYTTNFLYDELKEHKRKLIKISGYTELQFERAFGIITNKIRVINFELIPQRDYLKAFDLVSDIDIDDIEFVALTEHVKGHLWTSDKILRKGLLSKKWERLISTEELYRLKVKAKK